MTAEIAVLNKDAVALASDSKVTISSGSSEQKIFDNADKLFEISNHNPIGVMVFNGLQFLGFPLSVLIRDFRKNLGPVDSVSDAADQFLEFLKVSSDQSSEKVMASDLAQRVIPLVEAIRNQYDKAVQTDLSDVVQKMGGGESFDVENFRKIPNER